jgi:hypothetical protein
VASLEVHRGKYNRRKNVNVVLAGFVKEGALLKLYTYLDTLDDSELYCDTKSIVYKDNVGDSTKVQAGYFLGDVTKKLQY